MKRIYYKILFFFGWRPKINYEAISGYLRVTNKAMKDIPAFVEFINTRLGDSGKKSESDK